MSYLILVLVSSSCACFKSANTFCSSQKQSIHVLPGLPSANGVWEILGKRSDHNHHGLWDDPEHSPRLQGGGPCDTLLRLPAGDWSAYAPTCWECWLLTALQLRPSLEIAFGWREVLCPKPHPLLGQPTSKDCKFWGWSPAGPLPQWVPTLKGLSSAEAFVVATSAASRCSFCRSPQMSPLSTSQ